MKNKLINFLNIRVGFISLLLAGYWVKTIFVVYADFNVKFSDPYQQFIMWTSPIGMTLIILSLGFYLSKPIVSYLTMFVLDIILTSLLYSNVIYTRQFNDFITFNTIISSSKVSKGLGMSAFSLMSWTDIFVFLDLVIIAGLFLTKKLKIDPKNYGISKSFAVTSLGVFFLGLNMTLTETARPRLLLNTFDRSYGVKYLGVNTFLAYDALKTTRTNTIKANSTSDEINQILSFTQNNYAHPNPNLYGIAKGKNVFVIHLESFQQFLINLKVDGVEVTPFLNSLVKEQNTTSFDNFFHQVGLGRTSDAETMLETGTFGLNNGSVFTSLGSDNTFQAAPAILGQQQGYSSAVFHGNSGSFWNRNDVYKNFGYNYFFDSNYYSADKENSIGYGLKDKLLFAESIKYLEQMQQPFYVKYLTVTNHVPYPLDAADTDFLTNPTENETVNKYLITAHYLDQALGEFFTYLKKVGLYDKSLFVFYGDHYGLTDAENQVAAQLIGKDTTNWDNFQIAQMQRVPLIIHGAGMPTGVNHTYGGEIDILPTLEHLLGINNQNYVQFGSDLFSSAHRSTVIFRNGNFVSPTYTVLKNSDDQNVIYQTTTGQVATDLTDKQKQEVEAQINYTKQSLAYSDDLNNKNLLKLYTPAGFTPVNPAEYSYLNQMTQLQKFHNQLGVNSTSVFSQNNNQTTTGLYETNAPEVKGNQAYLTQVPATAYSNENQ